MKKGKVSNAVIRRLPRYYGQLDSLYQVGVVRISSSALGKAMNLTASQIRQDLSCFGEFGQQGYGYNVESLRNEIAEILGMNLGHTAIILGAGNLGRALIHNFQFSQNGFRLTAAFDTVPSIVGRSIAGVPVYSIDMLDQYLAEHPTSVGVLTVPQSVALSTAQRLIAGGVKGLWNFTNIELGIRDPGVVVENVHFADSLLALSYLISPGGPNRTTPDHTAAHFFRTPAPGRTLFRPAHNMGLRSDNTALNLHIGGISLWDAVTIALAGTAACGSSSSSSSSAAAAAGSSNSNGCGC